MKPLLAFTAMVATLAAPAQSSVIERIAPIGQWVSLAPGVQVEPLKVLEDSRCPVMAQCIWAGQVVVSVRVNDHRHRSTVKLTLGKPLQVGKGRLTLDQVLPDKQSGKIPPRQYRFGFSYIPGPPPPGEAQPL